MELYTPSEITKKITGVTGRMLTDLAEKGFIIPAKESAGQGSPRLYNRDNLFQIMFAVAVRGMFSHETLLGLLYVLKQNEHNPKEFMILTHDDRTNKQSGIDVKFIDKFDKTTKKEFDELLTVLRNEGPSIGVRKNEPRNDTDKFASVVVNIAGMKRFIEKKF